MVAVPALMNEYMLRSIISHHVYTLFCQLNIIYLQKCQNVKHAALQPFKGTQYLTLPVRTCMG